MNILFLSNPVRRDGAPLRLREIIEYLKYDIENVSVDVLTDKTLIGNIYANLVNNFYVIDELVYEIGPIERIKNKILRKDSKLRLINKIVSQNNYAIIYANSIVTLERAVFCKKISPNSKLILHLRELETICMLQVPEYRTLIKEVDYIIAISQSVFDFVHTRCDIPKEKIVLAYSGTHLERFKGIERGDENRFIVGAVGGMSWRKGIDFFIQTAIQTIKKNPDIHFEWIGVSKKDKFILDRDLENLNLQSNISFLEESVTIMDKMKKWSLFLSVAREEPLGVAGIEAGAMGIPYLSFRNTGGPEEIINDGGGVLVDYLDSIQLSDCILDLYEDKEKYNNLSHKISNNVSKYDIQNSLIKISHLIQNI